MSHEHVHLIGIGGTGMSSLAGLLRDSGCLVTGSDNPLYPPTSGILEDLGIEVFRYAAANLDPVPDLIVVGNAVRRGNPEAEAVLDRKLPYASMPQVLYDRFLRDRHAIVVAGTHGKTTITSMLAWVLHQAGRDPGFLIGGLPQNFPSSFRIGSGPAFLVEGDEYDTAFFDKGPKFMHYRPDTALIGTVEFDHADIYRDLGEVERVFRWFTNTVPRRGLIVRHEDCDITRQVTAKALARVTGYGLTSGAWRATDLRDGAQGSSFVIVHEGRRWTEVSMRVSGEYNVRNALAAAAAAAEQGLSAAEVAQGLATFQGVKRRLEVRGEVDDVVVLDDFAHHPTAIAETLRAVRQRYPGRRVWAVLEPRSWSLRRKVFQDRLPHALAGGDEIVLAEVFGAGEVPADERLDPERLVRDLAAMGRPARFLPTVEAIASYVSAHATTGDVVTVMSNGGFGGLHERLLSDLQARVTR